MTRKEENAVLINNLSTSFTGTIEEGKVFMLGNISAILIDISKSLAVIADEKPDPKETDDVLTYYTARCTSCGKVSPIGDYCLWCGEKGTCLEGGEAE